MRRFAVVLTLAVLAVPAASADILLDQPEGAGGLIEPEGEGVEYAVPFMITCDELFPQDPTANRTVVFDTTAGHPELIVQGGHTYSVPTDACPTRQGVHESTQRFRIAATRDAPGEEVLPVQFEAWMTAGSQPLVHPATEKVQVQTGVVVAFDGRISASLERAIVPVVQEAKVPIHIENLGNAATRVHATLVDQSGQGRILLPEPAIVESPTMGRTPTEASMVLVFHEPAGAWSETTVTLDLQPLSAKGTEAAGDPVRVSVLFRNTGGLAGEAVPALPPALVLLGLAAVAAVVRRR